MVVFCNLRVNVDETITGEDNESYWYLRMQRNKEIELILDWAVDNGYIDSGNLVKSLLQIPQEKEAGGSKRELDDATEPKFKDPKLA